MQINQEYYENLIANTHMYFLCRVTCPYPILSSIPLVCCARLIYIYNFTFLPGGQMHFVPSCGSKEN